MSNKESVFNEIPSDSLKGWGSFTVLVSSMVIQIMGLTFGAQLFWMTSFKNFVLSITLGGIIMFLLFCMSGNVGRVKRIPTAALYGNIFGRLGTRILTILLLPTGIVWIAWVTEIAGNSFVKAYASLDFRLVVGLIITASVLSSIKGVKGMEFSGYIQIPIVVLFMLVGCFGIFKGNGNISSLMANSNHQLNLFQGIVFTILTWITFIPFYSDYTRYIKSKKDMYVSTGLSWIVINTLVMLVGGVFASYSGENFDLISIFKSLGIPEFLPLIIIVLCTWTFNDRSLYSYGISINVILGKEKYKNLMMVLGGVAACILAFIGVGSNLLKILDYLGAVFSPLLGIFLCEYYARGGVKTGLSDFQKMPNLKERAFLPWIIGALLALVIKKFQPALSMVVSFMVYYIIESVFEKKRIKEAALRETL